MSTAASISQLQSIHPSIAKPYIVDMDAHHHHQVPLGMPKVKPLHHRPVSQRLLAIEDFNCRQAESEYREENISHIKEMEGKTLADASMMDLQPELEWSMRPFLLDFLIDSHLSLRLQPQTLFLAINLTDRYCSKRVVFKKHYQLVGCTALWIAAKYEDKKSRVPTISELKSMCCSAYEEDMFTQMEGHILNTLDWNLGHPTIETFLGLVCPPDAKPEVLHVARYLCECTLFHRAFVGISSSTIASSAFILANHVVNMSLPVPGNLTAEQYQCISLLDQYIKSPSKSLSRKYSSEAFCRAAELISEHIAEKEHQQLLREQEEQQKQQEQAAAAAHKQFLSNSHGLHHPQPIPVANQHITLPPTPPPAFPQTRMFTPPSLSASSTSSPSLFSTPGVETPVDGVFSVSKSDLFIAVPPSAPFRIGRGEHYITPPCTPVDGGASNAVSGIAPTSSSSLHYKPGFYTKAQGPTNNGGFSYTHGNYSAPNVF